MGATNQSNNRKFVIIYILFVCFLLGALLFVYKISARSLRLGLISFVNKVRYASAVHSARTPAKKEWLTNWPAIEESWNKINYLVHVPYLMFQYTPNVRSPHLNTNDMGFRGKQDYSHLPSVPVDESYRYILLLGGSSAFGAFSVSDENSISGRLEAMLNEAYTKGRPFKVINLSAGFYNSFQEFIAYVLYGLKFKPAAVVTFDGFNDASVSCSVHEGKRVPMVSGNYYYTKEVLDAINRQSLRTQRNPAFLTQLSTETAWDKESKDYINDVAELYARNLGLICLLAREQGSKVVLTLQPVHVLKDGRLAWRYGREDLEQIYRLMPQKVRGVAEKYGAVFIDFQEIFSKSPELNDYFAHTDPVHLIDKGQEAVARSMFAALQKMLSDE